MRLMTNLRVLFPVLATLGVIVPATASAATLTVGTGKSYVSPCAAIGAAGPGDTIEVDAGTYAGDSCYLKVDGLTVRGIGGRAKLDMTGQAIAGKKGIFVVGGNNITLEHLEFTGAAISDDDGANGAGIRMEGKTLVVRDCFFHDNQNGILATPLETAGSSLLVEYSEFDHNGIGNGCNVGGCTHNMYINHLDSFTLQYSYSHNADSGHLVKTRALENHILYNRIGSEGNGTTSYEIDVPNGGLTYLIGNTIQKDAQAGNGFLVAYAEEGASNPVQSLFAVNNTFVSAKGSTFVSVPGGFDASGFRNNVFAGAGSALSQGTLPASNLTGQDPLFVNAAGQDFHLLPGSPAIDTGTDPGSNAGFSLTPVDEYFHPLQKVARSSDGKLDLGAFEHSSGGQGGSGQGGQAGSGQAGSGEAGSGQAGSGQAGSGQAGSGEAGSGQAGSGQAGSGQAGSGEAGSGQAGSGTAGSGQSGQAGIAGSGQSGQAGSGTGGMGGSAGNGQGGAAGSGNAGAASKGGAAGSGSAGHAGGGKGGASGSGKSGGAGASGDAGGSSQDDATAESGDDGGCGVAVHRGAGAGAGWLLLALGAAGLKRRRR